MTTLKVIVADENADSLKRSLREMPYVKSIEDTDPASAIELNEPETAYERIKKIQQEIGDKELFKDIKDPSEWQRKIRKEWDRDF